MSGSRVEWKGFDALQARLKRLSEGFTPDSRAAEQLRQDIQQIARADYLERLAKGVDASGKSFAPLAASTLKDHKRGSGAPLNPTGSRVASQLAVSWQKNGDTWELVAGWPGLEFMQFHISGTYNMPARNPLGLSQPCLDKIRDRIKAFLADLASNRN